MEFTRKHRVKGKTVKTYKEWRDETDQYRIIWRSQVCGVEVSPGFSASVRAFRSLEDQTEYWGFANRRGLYRTLKAAIKGCEESLKLWRKLATIEGRDKVKQVQDLRAHAMIGSGRDGYSAFTDMPVWTLKEVHPCLLEIIS